MRHLQFTHHFKQLLMKLKHSYHQARPGQKTVTQWELVEEKGRNM